MDFKQHFLQQDIHRALSESVCINNCTYLLEQSLSDGKFKQAKFAIENISRSVNELKKLNDRKIEYEKLEQISKYITLEQLKRWE